MAPTPKPDVTSARAYTRDGYTIKRQAGMCPEIKEIMHPMSRNKRRKIDCGDGVWCGGRREI